MNIIVEDLENFYIPLFEKLNNALSARYPMLKCSVSSFSKGLNTSYQGHSMGIECTFPEFVKEQADSLYFSIRLYHLTSTPKLMVDIAWEHPSGHVEWELANWNSSEDWLDVTPALLEQVAGIFPDLCQLFAEIIHQHYVSGEG